VCRPKKKEKGADKFEYVLIRSGIALLSPNTVHDSRNIILEYTGAGFLAGQAADAELDFLSFQGDEFHLISHAFRTFGELLRQGMAVGTRTETGGYDNNFFHQIWLLALIRSAKLTFGLR
jgi:hypothetical protein